MENKWKNMQESKRNKKSKNTGNLEYKQSRKSIKSDNIHVPLTSSTFQKIKASSSRPSTAKSGSSTNRGKRFSEPEEPVTRLPHSRRVEVPGNVAVHFASFYQNLEEAGAPLDEERSSSLTKSSRNLPKMEFTRQMVHKLEHSAGTLDYGRQVSSLLEKTVESPGFDLKLPPPDNCAPSDKPCSDYYPLWYKDPNKMPQISRQQFRELKYKLKNAETNLSEKNHATGDSDFCYTDQDEKEEEFGYKFQLSRKSSRSSRTESQLASCGGKSELTASRCSSSLNSSFSETETDADEISDELEDDEDWETSDEKVEVKVVRNFENKSRNVRRGFAIAAKL